MPKAFDPKEKAAIRDALMRAGLRRFTRTGVRAARVEDICRDAGIAKGSFYAFFPSKEDLFMAIADEREAQHRTAMMDFALAAKGSQQKRAAAFFDMLIERIETDPVLIIATEHDEIAHLARKVGPDRLRQGQEGDRRFVAEIAERWPGGPLDADALLGLMTLMLTLCTSRRAMTDDQFLPTLALLRELFIRKLVGGKEP
jgi:AcrR family transcriptional regulator